MEDGRRQAGCHHHLKLVERYLQSLTSRLDIRLLAGPARKESLRLATLRKGAECGHFTWREESFGNPFCGKLSADVLHINAESPPSTNGTEGELMGVREVE